MGDVSFQIAGPIQRCINVSIVNDSVVEYDETLTVELLGADVSYPTILPSTAVISIVDDDGECHQTVPALLCSSVTTN